MRRSHPLRAPRNQVFKTKHPGSIELPANPHSDQLLDLPIKRGIGWFEHSHVNHIPILS